VEMIALPRSSVAASWERSVGCGLRREDRGLFTHHVSRTHSKRVEDENHRLIGAAGAEVRELYRSLGSARWIALCTNAAGEVVCWAGDRNSAPRRLRVLMHPGRRLTESELGTTAPGCTLVDSAVTVVTREEHFLHELKDFYCASAPIMGVNGTPAGVIDISGIDIDAVQLATELVAFAARRTENSLLNSMPCAAVLRFHCDERLLDTPFEGLIAVDGDGRICGANRAARQLLLMHRSPQIGLPLQSLVEGDLGEVLRKARTSGDGALRVRLHSETFGFVSVGRRTVNQRPTFARARARPAEYTFITPILGDAILAQGYAEACRLFSRGVPIVFQGATGTGKETLARALHHDGGCSGPFIHLHCGQISESSLQTYQLHGTCATGATLFLDEVSDTPMPLQRLLLDIVEQRDATSSETMGADRFKIVCSTKTDLASLVRDGKMREDLFYRLNGFRLCLPALRERTDLAAIVDSLLRRFTPEQRMHIDVTAIDPLLAREWPGNIRELEQFVRKVIALQAPGQRITVADIVRTMGDDESANGAGSCEATNPRELAELRVIRHALQSCNGNVAAAARLLKLSRGTLYKRLAKLRDT